MSDVILSAKNLFKSFSLEAGFFAKKNQNVYAVNDVSFDLKRGETLGLVGESGCGKTTTARMLVRMYEATSGQILYYENNSQSKTSNVVTNGGGENAVSSNKIAASDETAVSKNPSAIDISSFSKSQLGEYRQKVKYIFQDPARSLNPRMTVLSILTDAFKKRLSKPELLALASKTIQEVGLAESDLYRRPAEFSGGQRQRISIARGLIMNPEVLICDEVVSALDVSIQGQILNLLQDLRAKKNLSFVFITHDLKVACWFCDRIAVMYRGVIVEEAPAQDLYKNARHPYTKLLFDGAFGQGKNAMDVDKIPPQQENETEKASLEVKTTLTKEKGCPFAHRCPYATEKCDSELPNFKDLGSGHKARCFYL